MKTARIALTVLVATTVSIPVLALDRGAGMVDWVTIQGGMYDKADTGQVTIWGEQAAAVEEQNVSWLVGVGYVYSSPDEWDNDGGFLGALGLKYYPISPLSVAVIGQYEGYGSSFDYSVWSARLDGIYRFISADEAVSPYVRGIGGVRSVKNEYLRAEDDSGTQVYGQAGLGCDVMMTDTLAFVLEGMLSVSDNISATYALDGWLVGFSMKYYFP